MYELLFAENKDSTWAASVRAAASGISGAASTILTGQAPTARSEPSVNKIHEAMLKWQDAAAVASSFANSPESTVLLGSYISTAGEAIDLEGEALAIWPQ